MRERKSMPLDSYYVPGSTPKLEPATTKMATIRNMLRRDQGATLAELVDAVGWVPNTMRPVLSGLRKKGLRISKSKRDGRSCYRISDPA